MKREENLVITLCRSTLNEEDRQVLERLLAKPLDWDEVLKRASREGVIGLAFRHLNQPDYKGRVPEVILERLRNNYYVQLVKNTSIFEEAKRILAALNVAGLKAIGLKGVFLTQNFYNDLGVRPVTDIDILIHKEDIVKANEIFLSLGYLPPAYYRDFLQINKAVSLNAFLYYQPEGNFYLHLHRHIINSTWPLDSLVERIDMCRFWEFAQPVSIDGIGALTLSPCHLLIYLAQHSASHAFKRLILSCDIMEAIKFYRQQGLNWNEVIKEAKRFGLSEMIYAVLSYVCRRLNFHTPQLEKSRPGYQSWFLAAAYFMYLRKQEGALNKIKFLRKIVFPPRYIIAHNLNLAFAQVRPRHYWQRIAGKVAG